MEQMFMFGAAPEPSSRQRRPAYRALRRENDGPTPLQRELRIKLLRKIAFRHRTHEPKGVGNSERWTLEGIVKLHQVLVDEWSNRFPYCTNPVELYDYWMWMTGDDTEAYSFRDCLVASGYTHPDEFINACENLMPKWFKEIQALPVDKHVGAMQELVKRTDGFIPARKLLDNAHELAA